MIHVKSFLKSFFSLLKSDKNSEKGHSHLNESYSQHGEDVILVSLFNYKKDGFYVDVGAHHPYRFSNTHRLFKMGWRGINIDPIPGSKSLFDAARPRDVNLEFGIGGCNQDLIYNIFEEGALNTFCTEMVDQAYVNYSVKPISKKIVKVVTLAECLDKYIPINTVIDLLNVDVEGLDYEVLKSNDWLKYKPKVIVCEIANADINTIICTETYIFLVDMGYKLVSKTILSCIFVLE